MSKKRLGFVALMLAMLAIGSILIAACARPGSPTASSSNKSGGGEGGGNSTTVHMGTTNFLVSSITIPKGSKLTLVDDVQVPHIIQNGSWDASGTAKPANEAGAPTVNDNFSGGDTKDIGPFTTAGTYHLFCTIHTGMNLTVTVK